MASAYHQLGIIAQVQRDFSAAEGWYKKALAITEKLGNTTLLLPKNRAALVQWCPADGKCWLRHAHCLVFL